MTAMPALVLRYFACVDAEAWDELAQLWADDAEFVTFGAGGRRVRRGRAEIMAAYPRLFRGWAQHRDEPVRAFVAGDAITVEIRSWGMTADGIEVAYEALDVFEPTDDGRIQRLSNWYDIVTARKAFGA